ncbi:SMC-Scp complex subunit ScpB [Thiohalorhabdus methylotrophus]|uniref:SMC-Scp complex subunit ScpB n=1 Tax=Thiohalorhabdus methylotrophus TaxID=3242694 RepID=A0ABV4TXB0_9GAMM
MTRDTAKLRQIVEAALFAAQESLSIAQLQRLFDEETAPGREDLETVLGELQAEYADRGVHLVDTSGGYQFQTHPDTTPWIHRLHQSRPPRFSRAVLETLAIIAYRQPTTRSEIEDIRGVSLSSGVLKTLTEREWIQVVGRKEVPGRPSLYGTTRQFLGYFGLSSLDELPPLKDVQEADIAALAAHLDPDGGAEDEASTDDPGTPEVDDHG